MTCKLTLGIEQPRLDGLDLVAEAHAVQEATTACGRSLGGLSLLGDRGWPPPANRSLARCRLCDHVVASHLATGEPILELTAVEWLVDSRGAAHQGGGSIGGYRYNGTPGERATIRADHAAVLAGAGHLRRLGGAGQAP